MVISTLVGPEHPQRSEQTKKKKHRKKKKNSQRLLGGGDWLLKEVIDLSISTMQRGPYKSQRIFGNPRRCCGIHRNLVDSRKVVTRRKT